MFAEKPLCLWLFETHVASQLSGSSLRMVILQVFSQPSIHTSPRYKEYTSMTSNLLTRRAMLSGGALLGMSALLSACGQQANNEAAATASTAPSETTSATGGESPTASATPSTIRGYSGGSKAPDGEYRKADGYGPAQNVPLPKAEPQQYPETTQGLYRMMKDWVVAHNYAIQTGDCSYAFKYVTEDAEEYGFYEYLEEMYSHGGWVADGLDIFISIPLIYNLIPTFYFIFLTNKIIIRSVYFRRFSCHFYLKIGQDCQSV